MPDLAPATRAERAALAEASVLGRHLYRLWVYPPGRLGTSTSPAPWPHRTFRFYNFWWQAHLLDCLVDAEVRSPDAGRRRTIARLPRALFVRNRFSLINEYFDDIAWLALAMGRARHEAGVDTGWRDRQIGRLLHGRWRDTDAAGGGIPWRKGDTFRNVPANGSMAILMARMGRPRRTLETVDWIYAHLHDPATGLILEGRRPDGIDARVYTYNQGLVLGALLELVVAGHEASRPRLRALVDAIDAHCATDGVLNGCGGGDGGLFAAITARYLAGVAERLPLASEADRAAGELAARLVRLSADAAWDNRATDAGEDEKAADAAWRTEATGARWKHRAVVGTAGAKVAGEHGERVWFGPDWRVPAVVPDAAGTSADSGVRSSEPAERDLSVQLAGWMVQELAARLDAVGVPVT